MSSKYHPGGSRPVRSRLIAEALAFVRAARQIEGITRIALIGSLTMPKVNPKDVDVLVTVVDGTDLALVATLGRKIQGHTISFGYGGEVFVADDTGRYRGRTCPWATCGPGIRRSCNALNCGKWHYLHDDLDAVTLADDLIAEPPIELWPRIVTRVPVPDDVTRELLAPLAKEGSVR